ncbi:MAG: hypothetical protein N3A01_01820 [Bacteroidales bacterium]|nr:hypothetical protein [Bacteroidales bacterium]
MHLSRKNIKIIIILFIVIYEGECQFLNNDYIFYQDSRIKSWATKCYVQRGYKDISNKNTGHTTWGNENNATYKADNIVVSLGDSGIAVCKFNKPIRNGIGYDFAIFENAFVDSFLELAHVEVSTDSINWFRFPSISLTQTNFQVGTFGYIDPNKIYNLAGKYKALYGTLFDIDELPHSPYLNKNKINYVKIIDVVGCIDCSSRSYDSKGNIINDPYPTPFETGGFDLDAIAVINELNDYNDNINFIFYNKTLYLDSYCNLTIFNINGQEINKYYNVKEIFLSYPPGIYIIKHEKNNTLNHFRICIY